MPVCLVLPLFYSFLESIKFLLFCFIFPIKGTFPKDSIEKDGNQNNSNNKEGQSSLF
jgi:hypothetical protein